MQQLDLLNFYQDAPHIFWLNLTTPAPVIIKENKRHISSIVKGRSKKFTIMQANKPLLF